VLCTGKFKNLPKNINLTLVSAVFVSLLAGVEYETMLSV